MAKLTPLKAIRKKYLECCNGQYKEVRECSIKDCALWQYRDGHRPTQPQGIEEPTEEEIN